MGNKQIYVGKVSDYVFLSVVELDAINNMQNKVIIRYQIQCGRFWNNLHQVRSKSKDWKENYLKF